MPAFAADVRQHRMAVSALAQCALLAAAAWCCAGPSFVPGGASAARRRQAATARQAEQEPDDVFWREAGREPAPDMPEMPEGLDDDGFEEEEFDAAEFDREFMQMQMEEGGMGGMVPTDDYDGPGIVPSGQPEVPEWDQWVPESLERRQSLGEAQDRLGMSDEMRRNMADHLNPRTLEANDPTRVQQRMEEEEERQMKLAWGQELLATREQKELNFFEKPAPEEDAKLAWWEKEAQELTEAGALKMRSPIAWVDKVHDSMSEEEREFEKEINDIIIAGKRGLLRLRMQQAADIPGRKGYALQTKIKKTIRDAERLLDHHQRARGMTQEQRRRLKLRRSLALEVEYESAYGVGKFWTKKSRSWKRRWGKIV